MISMPCVYNNLRDTGWSIKWELEYYAQRQIPARLLNILLILNDIKIGLRETHFFDDFP